MVLILSEVPAFPVWAWAWASFVSFFLVSAVYKGQPADGAQGAADPTSGPSVAVFLRPLALLLPRSSPDGCDLFDGTGTTIAAVVSFLGAGPTQGISQDSQQALPGFTEKIHLELIGGGLNVNQSWCVCYRVDLEIMW